MKKINICAILILSIFVGVCIATSVYYGDKLLLGNFNEYNNDDVKYLRSADTFNKTGKITYRNPNEETVFIMPGIVLLLSPFVKIFGIAGAVIPFRIFNAIITAISLYFLFKIALKVFDARVALITLILNVIYIPNIYATTQVLTESAFLLLFMSLVLVSIYAVKTKKIKYYITGGILLGLAILFRPAIALFPIIIFFVWLINRYTVKEMFRFAIITIIPLVLVMAPWWIRNYNLTGQFVPFTLSSGNPMLQGAFINNKVDLELIKELNVDNLQYTDDEIHNNEIETEFAKRVMKYNFANNAFEYGIWMTFGKTITNFVIGYLWYPLFGVTFAGAQVQHLIFIVIAIIGAILLIKNKRKDSYMFLFIILYFALTHLPFLAFQRYMYPIMPIIIMIGASAFERRNHEKDISNNSHI